MIEGETGVLFKEQTVESLSKAIKRFEGMKFDPRFIRKHAEQFDVEHFKQKILNHIEKEWKLFKAA